MEHVTLCHFDLIIATLLSVYIKFNIYFPPYYKAVAGRNLHIQSCILLLSPGPSPLPYARYKLIRTCLPVP